MCYCLLFCLYYIGIHNKTQHSNKPKTNIMESKVSNIAAFVESLVNNEFSEGQQAMVLVGEDAVGGDNILFTNSACTNDENSSCSGSNSSCVNVKTCMGINSGCNNTTNKNTSTTRCPVHNASM